MIISLVCAPPFLAVERARETAIFCQHLVRLVMKLVVAKFCRAKDHESMKVQSVWSENAMQFLHHNQLATSLLPHISNRLVGLLLASR